MSEPTATSGPTSLHAEQDAQRAWVLRDDFATVPLADQLLAAEFHSPEEAQALADARLRRILLYALTRVPWYARIRQRLRIPGRDLGAQGTLQRLPCLTSRHVQQHGSALRTRQLPPGETVRTMTRTSGTTGRPTVVYQSTSSRRPFSWLKQRELRWFRWDPTQAMAVIRPGIELPKQPDGDYLQPGGIHREPHWPRVGPFFHTGPLLAITNTNPVADQLAFLRAENPPYLLSQASVLEHLALSAHTPPSDALRRVQAISQTLTGPMEATVAERLGVGVDINYGFNEIGLIASRCREGGRYHVHAEHAHVELLDEDGQPAAPGTHGRIVVTGLTNYAMPLLRYDSGDYALVTDGPCPCGRTLPSFGPILGRYRRIAYLPPGTWQRWGALQYGIHGLPRELKGAVEAYQGKQFKDGSWEFRLTLHRDVLDPIAERLRAAFVGAVDGEEAPPIRFVRVETFERADARKFQDFLSEFQPSVDDDRIPEAPHGD